MDINELWEKASKQTEIHRLRLTDLATFESTQVQYVFLAESGVNRGDTVVRKGHMIIEKPILHLPGYSPLFEGLEFDPEMHLNNENLSTFLMMRGVRFPSLRFRNQGAHLDVYEGSLQTAINHFSDQLARAEDINTGLVTGPEDAWQFSVLLLVGALVIRSSDGDIRRLLDRWRKRG